MTAVNRIWKALQSLGQVTQAPDSRPKAEAAMIPEAAQEVCEMSVPEPATATPVAPQTLGVATEEAPAGQYLPNHGEAQAE
jgi:hypothetical protein